MQVNDECEPGFSYWTLKIVSGVIKVTHRRDLFYVNTSDTDTLLVVPLVSVLERFNSILLLSSSKFGQCLLAMKNESGDLSQSETAKYFEWIMINTYFSKLMTGFEGNSEAGNSLNLAAMAVVSQHLRVTVQCYTLTS